MIVAVVTVFHISVENSVTSISTHTFSPFLTLQETTVDDAHIRAINALAMKLERQNKEETKTIYERRKRLNEK